MTVEQVLNDTIDDLNRAEERAARLERQLHEERARADDHAHRVADLEQALSLALDRIRQLEDAQR